MHATPQRLRIEEPGQLPSLRPVPPGPNLEQRMLRFLRLLRLAFWRAFVHDAFATAKASAYSSILTFFPVLLIIGSVLANWRKGAALLTRNFLRPWQHSSGRRQHRSQLSQGSRPASCQHCWPRPP